MRSSFAQAVKQENLRPAGGPRIEPIALGPDIGPQVRRALRGAARDQGQAGRGARHREAGRRGDRSGRRRMIENMRGQRPVFTAVERAARDTDRVLLDYQAPIGGRLIEDGDLKDVQVVLGTRQAMPELEEGLKGVSAGRGAHADRGRVPGQSPEQAASPGSLRSCTSPLRRSRSNLFRRSTRNSSAPTVSKRAAWRRCAPRCTRAWNASWRGRAQPRARAGDGRAVPATTRSTCRARWSMSRCSELQLDTARRMGIRDASRLPPRERFEEPARRRVALGLLISQIVQAQGMKVERAARAGAAKRADRGLPGPRAGAARLPAEPGRHAPDRVRGARGTGDRLDACTRAGRPSGR